ncbi:MAG: hypothetical protein HC925_00940 [Coleofasciculaceae cyanobacterium SM2_3_26]|nr:hypothetical protein [Coleofasciculaceae cyanobacterium SM2_3_26]
MNELLKYRINCTLSFGDIYGQIIVWLIVIFLSLASALALWSSARELYAFVTVGLILVLSLPFLLFAFVTTLLNHIEITPTEETSSKRSTSVSSSVATRKPAEA